MKADTVQDIDGFKIDLNRLTRREFHGYISRIRAAQSDGDMLMADEISGEFLERVVIEWPFQAEEITKLAYLDLPMHDAARVDNAIEKAIDTLTKKK